MLPRFLEPQAGRVLFDGEDIAWGTLESIRAEAIYVGGDDPCFTGTVNENIRCGDARYDSSAVMEAAKIVHAHQFIQRLPLGYETPLGEHGEMLTAGQMFLLGLARAIIRNPRILVLDDALSSVDTHTEEQILNHLREVMQGRTTIFISHRVSTVRNADRIAVLHAGRIVELGTHDELIARNGYYTELYNKQLLEEELAEV